MDYLPVYSSHVIFHNLACIRIESEMFILINEKKKKKTKLKPFSVTALIDVRFLMNNGVDYSRRKICV